MAPFLGASIAVTVAALMLGGVDSLIGRVTSATAVLLALLSFGPQKWLDPSIGRIWPAVLLAQVAVVVIGISWFAALRDSDRRPRDERVHLSGTDTDVLALFALMTGFFYAFSVAVMPGLDAIDARHSIPAMQSINLLVRNPVFFITFFVTPVAALVVAMGTC